MTPPRNELKIAILATLVQIPYGTVSSYGKIAERAGFYGRARYVGYLLKHLPKDSKIPWHRVLKSSGHIAFPESDPRHETQQTRLIAEGVSVIAGKVSLKNYGWH